MGKRILLFVATNIAIMVTLSIVMAMASAWPGCSVSV